MLFDLFLAPNSHGEMRYFTLLFTYTAIFVYLGTTWRWWWWWYSFLWILVLNARNDQFNSCGFLDSFIHCDSSILKLQSNHFFFLLFLHFLYKHSIYHKKQFVVHGWDNAALGGLFLGQGEASLAVPLLSLNTKHFAGSSSLSMYFSKAPQRSGMDGRMDGDMLVLLPVSHSTNISTLSAQHASSASYRGSAPTGKRSVYHLQGD